MQTEKSNGRGVTLDKLMTDLKVVVDDGQKLLKTGATQLRERTVTTARATDKAIRKNPYPSLGIIFGVGLVVGIVGYALMRSSSSSREEIE